MAEEKDFLRIHPNLREKYDHTSIYINEKPMRGEAGKFKDWPIGNLLCGVCGKDNVKLIHYTSGGTSDGTVEVKEVQCLDCGCFTMFWWSDRV